MQIHSTKGTRTCKVTKPERSVLMRARLVTRDIADLMSDKEAVQAAHLLEVIGKRYATEVTLENRPTIARPGADAQREEALSSEGESSSRIPGSGSLGGDEVDAGEQEDLSLHAVGNGNGKG